MLVHKIDHRGYYIVDPVDAGGTGHYLYSDGEMRPVANTILLNKAKAFWENKKDAEDFCQGWCEDQELKG